MAGAKLNGREFSPRAERRTLKRQQLKSQADFQVSVDVTPVFQEWTAENKHVSLAAAFALLWTLWGTINFAYANSPFRHGFESQAPDMSWLGLSIPPVVTAIIFEAGAAELSIDALTQFAYQRNHRSVLNKQVIADRASQFNVTPQRYLELVNHKKKN